jgi:hypothetical protein
MAYMYRHIRLDKNEPFYIGIGSDTNYKRAFSSNPRTKYWKNITNKTEYKVDIILDNLTWLEACEKEKEFIKIYKRNSDGGILCNITLGGEGAYGRKLSDDTKLKISKSVSGEKHGMFGKTHTQEAINKIKLKASKKVINTETNEIFNSITEVAIKFKIRPNTLTRKLTGIRKNNTPFKLL